MNIKGEKILCSVTNINTTIWSVVSLPLISLAACSVEVKKMNFKIISVFLYLSVVLSIVVQNNAFVPPNSKNDNNFRRRAADISGCKKVRIFFLLQILFVIFQVYL